MPVRCIGPRRCREPERKKPPCPTPVRTQGPQAVGVALREPCGAGFQPASRRSVKSAESVVKKWDIARPQIARITRIGANPETEPGRRCIPSPRRLPTIACDGRGGVGAAKRAKNGAKRFGVRQSLRLRGAPKRRSGATAAAALGGRAVLGGARKRQRPGALQNARRPRARVANRAPRLEGADSWVLGLCR